MFVSAFTLQKETTYAEVQWKPKGSPAPSGGFWRLSVRWGIRFSSILNHSMTLPEIYNQEAVNGK